MTGGCTRVFIHNLPYSINKPEAIDLFQEYGSVREVEMIMSRDGITSRGMCVVEFTNEEGAERCIRKINGMRMENRIVEAREDRGNGYIHPNNGKKGGGKGSDRYGGNSDRYYAKGSRYGGKDKGYRRSCSRERKGYGKMSGYGGKSDRGYKGYKDRYRSRSPMGKNMKGGRSDSRTPRGPPGRSIGRNRDRSLSPMDNKRGSMGNMDRNGDSRGRSMSR